MRKAIVVLAMLYMGVCAAAQSNTSGTSQDHPKKAKDQITVRGCVSKLNTDYILTQAEQGNSYQLQGSRKLRLGPYLGQQVEVTGTESPSMSTSSDYLARSGSASPVTITVSSIKTIAKRCSD
jgi:cellobiose phosphorylase